MTQEKTVELVLEDLLNGSMIPKIFYNEVHTYLMQVYAAGYDEGRKAMSHPKRVIQYHPWGERIMVHESATKAGQAIGLTKYMISKCATGKNKTAGGFIWRYEDAVQDRG